MKTRALVLVLMMALAGITFSGCGEDKKAQQASAQARPVLSVLTHTVAIEDIPIHLEFPARVRSFNHVEIRAKVQGSLIKRYYTEGAFVKKNDPLFLIEPDKYQAAVNMAKAQLHMQEAYLQQATRDWNRVSKLFSQGVVSEKERDSALSAFENAKASVTNAKAALDNASIDLGYTLIKAPFDGFAGIKQQDEGSLIAVNTVLMTLTQIDPIHVEFSISDLQNLKSRAQIRQGNWTQAKEVMQASVLDTQGNKLKTHGVIDFIDTRIDETTGSVQARAKFDNSEHQLLPGQFVRIVLEGLINKNAIKIPQQAVLQTAQGALVMTIAEGKVAPRPVALGATTGTDVIITSGLKASDVVIIDSLTKLRPGMPVQAKPKG